MFKTRRVCMRRKMKVVELLEFLTFGIHKFTLRLIFHQVDFDFSSDLD